MKTIEFALQDNCGNVISTYGTLAELREELLTIDEVATSEQAYDDTDDIVRDYVGFFEVEKLVDGEPSGTYNHVSDCDEGAITDEEHDYLCAIFGELKNMVAEIVKNSRLDMIASTLPSHLDGYYIDCNFVFTGFDSPEEFDEFLADHPKFDAAVVEYKGGNRMSVIYPDYVKGKGVDVYAEYIDYNETEVVEPMSREDLLSDIVEAQFSDDEEDNERIASYYAEALDKIAQVGDDELLLIYANGSADIVKRYDMSYHDSNDHFCEVCALISNCF